MKILDSIFSYFTRLLTLRSSASSTCCRFSLVSKGVPGMKPSLNRFLLRIVLCSILIGSLIDVFAQPQLIQKQKASPKTELMIENQQVRCTVQVQGLES